MSTRATLLDLHERTHRSLSKLLEHCRALSQEQLQEQLPGFGFDTLQQQLYHIIECEHWWTGVAQDAWNFTPGQEHYPDSDDAAKHRDIDALEAYRQSTAELTAQLLTTSSDEELNAVRDMSVGPGETVPSSAARLLMHAITHAFHHKGQAVAMCRLLGHPAPTTDLPVM